LTEFFREEVGFFCNVGMLVLGRKGIPQFKSWPQIGFTDFSSRLVSQ